MLGVRRYHCPRCGGDLGVEKSIFGGLTYGCVRCGSKGSAQEIADGQAQADLHRRRERMKLAEEVAKACEQANQEARTCPSCDKAEGLWLGYRFEYRSGHVAAYPREEGTFIVPRSPYGELPSVTLGEYECSDCGVVWFADLPRSPKEPGRPSL